MASILKSLNSLDFLLRSWSPPLRGAYKERGPERQQPFFRPSLMRCLSPQSQELCLFYRWIFEQLPSQALRRSQKAIDIGSKSFAYAAALSDFLLSREGGGELIGLEADGGRRFWNLYRRRDLARYYAALSNHEFPNLRCRYEEANWLERKPDRFDVISCFFPFLFEDLSNAWGLPPRYFDPRNFYQKIFAEAESVVFFHQGKEELESSLQLAKSLHRSPVWSGTFKDNPWMTRRHSVEVLLFSS